MKHRKTLKFDTTKRLLGRSLGKPYVRIPFSNFGSVICVRVRYGYTTRTQYYCHRLITTR